MNCRATRRRLAALAGGELGPRRTAAVRAHLERCQACRAEHGRFMEGLAALRRAGRRADLDLSPQAVWRDVRRRLAAADRVTSRETLRPRLAVPLAAAAAALVLAAGAAIGLWLDPWRAGTRGPVSVARGRADSPADDARPPRAYRLVVPPPFTLENAPRYETGLTTYHLPGLSPRDEAPGQGFVLEQVTYDPQTGQRMRF